MASAVPVKDKSESAPWIKVAPFRKEVRKTEPHKHHNYFEIVYFSKGAGFHTIDGIAYAVTPPVVFFVRKEQVHHLDLAEDTEPEGFVLILKKTFVDQSLDGGLKKLLSAASTLACTYLHHNLTIAQLFGLLVQESPRMGPNSVVLCEGLLKALFARMTESAKTAVKTTAHGSNLFFSFKELLSQERLQNKVAYYAGLLNTTPQNLNAVCRKAVSQTAAEVLAGHILGEAKRLLIYTGSTIREIAYELNFSDASHFVKYFKRITGHTPQAFRKIPS